MNNIKLGIRQKLTNIKRYVYLIILLVVAGNVYSQDPTYSQYMGNELNFNPAYTGTAQDLRFSATYRTLWPNVPGKLVPGPLSSYVANLDFMVKIGKHYRSGIGAFAFQDVEGKGFLTTSSIGISYCQHMPHIKLKGDMFDRYNIFLGFRTSYNQVKIDYKRLVFSDQIDPNYGILDQSSSYNNFGITRRGYVDLDLGILVRHNFRGTDNWSNEIGFSIAHVLAPSIAISGANNDASTLPRRYVISFRSAIKTTKQFYFGPLLLFELQGKYTSLKAGLDFYFKLNNNKNQIPLLFGLYHRTGVYNNMNTRSIIIAIGNRGILRSGMNNKYMTYALGLSADLTYGGLQMQTLGAYELTFSISIPTKMTRDYYDQKCIW
ncbi:MAG: PorP/SprF family type IX secretion system membrane protein [Bacteroidota bacterium]